MTEDVATLIGLVNQGDKQAEIQLVSELYNELRSMAGRAMLGERSNHTLQATALVNEALLRLLGEDIQYNDRLHFLRLCASTMRRVLVDYARARCAGKRGDNQPNITLNTACLSDGGSDDMALLSLDEAITQLSDQDPRKAQMMELRFFSGLDVPEIADVMQVSAATVARDIRFSRAWIKSRLDIG